MAEEEVIMEVEAVKAVYGEDCTFLSTFPPHLLLQIKPRTADDSSIQFVEASIEIQAGSQYPSDPPDIMIVSSKGLDEKRLQDLNTSLHDKALDLIPCPMLVALCEEAVEKLSIMNHPEGDCPLCLCPLVSEHELSESDSFMKLMSCYHCFHRWWRWLQEQNDLNGKSSSKTTVYMTHAAHQQENTGNCPVCRKVFQADDIKHVLNLVGSCSVQFVGTNDKEVPDDEKVLQSDSEISRRNTFETLLQLQRERGGLIEPRKDGVLFASMRLSESIPDLTPEVDTNSSRPNDLRVMEAPGPSRPPNKPIKDTNNQHRHRNRSMPTEQESQASSGKATSGQRRDGGTRKFGRKSSRSQAKQWIQKEK
ncbi:hypothetical protein V2J09_018235 [Rumex salicifolius]